MAARRKRTVPPKSPKPTKKIDRAPAERRCWLCSEPMASGTATSLFGGDALEVHRRCYEQAMKS